MGAKHAFPKMQTLSLGMGDKPPSKDSRGTQFEVFLIFFSGFENLIT
jgi:hypothetical protein